MRFLYGRNRKGISPVLATVVLVAITLVAATAIAGFIFGLMGTFTSTATVASGASSCSGTPEVCTISLQNTGSANVGITGVCNIKFGGNNYLSTAAILSGSLNAGSTASVGCTTPGSAHASPGTQIVGSVSIGNGAYVQFVATAT
ncbi:MAG TPA: archaellin/type IV pilin N-terminal domain-containing protein [Nitrososphaerales archaeon]|nr:archaellin/type IV pilin N-terminal domain-containing protein [Nitrososphaerales archaeon]